MAKSVKRDHTSLRSKLRLRRHFLETYHGRRPLDVVDCCQGAGILWRTLRREFKVASYLGIDIRRKAGRLTMDSSRFLSQPGWPQNVVDVDTYGAPWRHWIALLPNVSRPTTVFLTIGTVMRGATDALSLSLLGLDRFKDRRIPETDRVGSMRYIGLHLVPAPLP